MYTRQRTRIIGRDPDAVEPRAPKALAPKALGREAGDKGRAGSPVCRVGVGGGIAGPTVQQRPRYIPRSNPRVRSCERERGGARDGVVCRPSDGREAPAAKPLGAWHV